MTHNQWNRLSEIDQYICENFTFIISKAIVNKEMMQEQLGYPYAKKEKEKKNADFLSFFF